MENELFVHQNTIRACNLLTIILAVLTKPDKIGRGDEGAWIAMMRNQKEIFNHGWYCVRQPGTIELQDNITWEEARKNELDFFQQTAPWKDVEFQLKERLGTRKLSAALGKKLFDLIVKRYCPPDTVRSIVLTGKYADFRKFLKNSMNNLKTPSKNWIPSLQISAMIQ